jgi:hypothetical protein
MKLFKISQTENTGYDTFSDAVVCAANESIARNINPSNGELMTENDWGEYGSWCSSPIYITVEYIGEAAESCKEGLVLSSFHAG